MPDTIAIIAQGEMGSAVGGRLRQNGARVLTNKVPKEPGEIEALMAK